MLKTLLVKLKTTIWWIGSAILIDGNIYFFATVIEDDGLENVLFAINVDKKSIERYENNDLSLPGISIQQIGKKIISLKNKRINNEIITYLEIFDPEKETWEIVNEKRYNEQTQNGSALYVMCTDEKFIYVIEDNHSKNGLESYFVQYDQDLNETRRVLLEGELKDFLVSGKGRITEMRVWNQEYLYVKNLSSYGFVGCIGKIKLLKYWRKRIVITKSIYQDDVPILYTRGSQYYYNIKKNKKEKIAFAENILMILSFAY